VVKLLEQGKEKEAAELLDVLEWASGADAPKQKPSAPKAAEPASQKNFSAKQVLQIEEATALAQELKGLGMHQQAKDIEASLKQIQPAAVSSETRNGQLEDARAFAEKLQSVGKTKESKEIFEFVNQMEMHLKLEDLAAGKELKKNVDAVMKKLDEQLEMIGEYTNTIEDLIPSSKAEIKDTEQFGEVVTFLKTYVTIIERQLMLGKCWVEQLDKKDQAKYTKKIKDGQDTIQTMLVLMEQFQAIQDSVDASKARSDMVASLECVVNDTA